MGGATHWLGSSKCTGGTWTPLDGRRLASQDRFPSLSQRLELLLSWRAGYQSVLSDDLAKVVSSIWAAVSVQQDIVAGSTLAQLGECYFHLLTFHHPDRKGRNHSLRPATDSCLPFESDVGLLFAC